MSVSTSEHDSTITQDSDFTFDVSFLKPSTLVPGDTIPELDMRSVSHQSRPELNSDICDVLDCLNWMGGREIFEVGDYVEEDPESKNYGKTFKQYGFYLDDYLLARLFETQDEDYVSDAMDGVMEVLEGLGWSDLEFDYDLFSESDGITLEEIKSLEGDDPVVELYVYLRVEASSIQNPINRTLH